MLSIAPPALVYGSTYRRWRADITRSEHDEPFIRQRADHQLRRLLGIARTTAFYADHLRGVDVDRVTAADLPMLPVMDRETVRQHLDRMLTVPKSQLDESITSGTTSAPLHVYLDRDRSVREWAFVTHIWSRAGFRLRDRRAVLRHGQYDFPNVTSEYWLWDPGTRELRMSPFRMVPEVMEEYLDLIERYRVAWLHGYPSAITLLARHAARIGWTAPRGFKGVLPISESLLPHQRETIRRAWGDLPIVRFYGLTEKVAFAGEATPCLGEYEFEPLYGIAEIVDDSGAPARAGERGRVVGTGFISIGMPLIRYYTGDQATVVEHAAAHNCWRLRVKDLVSIYKQDYLVTREGGLVTPTIAYIYTDLIQDYQFSQSEPGRATVRVVPAPGVTAEDLEFVAPKVAMVSDGLVNVDVEVVDEIPAGPRGKRRVVLQQLDLSLYGDADHRAPVT